MNKEQILKELAYNDEYKSAIAEQLDVMFSAINKHKEGTGLDIEVKDLSSSVEFLFNGFSLNYIYCHFDKSLKDYVNDIQMKLISWQFLHGKDKNYPVVVCKLVGRG